MGLMNTHLAILILYGIDEYNPTIESSDPDEIG
jgi:hypothetical protein